MLTSPRLQDPEIDRPRDRVRRVCAESFLRIVWTWFFTVHGLSASAGSLPDMSRPGATP
jgi:hypothetical protein